MTMDGRVPANKALGGRLGRDILHYESFQKESRKDGDLTLRAGVGALAGPRAPSPAAVAHLRCRGSSAAVERGSLVSPRLRSMIGRLPAGGAADMAHNCHACSLSALSLSLSALLRSVYEAAARNGNHLR